MDITKENTGDLSNSIMDVIFVILQNLEFSQIHISCDEWTAIGMVSNRANSCD